MVAVSKWMEFIVSSATSVNNGGNACVGKRGGVKGNVNYPGDSFSLVTNSNNQLSVDIDGSSNTITMEAGTSLDPRNIARDISKKLQSVATGGFTNAMCEWRNNKFYIWSGTIGDGGLGNSSYVALGAATYDAKNTLGFTTPQSVGNTSSDATKWYQQDNNAAAFTGTCTVSGTYTGQFDDVYTVVMTSPALVGNGTASGTNK